MKTNEINIRDPFVLPYGGKYYLYGTRGATCWGLADGFDAYQSNDLENWEGPTEIFHKPNDFWADRNYWAPEVHYYKGEFYLFASFKSKDKHRGTQILKADNPLGPYAIHSNGPVTPKDWECLDGTLYIDKNDQPYIVFCHEWTQVHDGEMCAMRLSADLKEAAGEPFLLFRASEPQWSTPFSEDNNYVTDGLFLYHCNGGDLIMIWSSYGIEGYTQAIARSQSGEITGTWTHDSKLLFKKDGGHGMIFRAFDNKLYLVLHSPNETLMERPKLIEISNKSNSFKICNM